MPTQDRFRSEIRKEARKLANAIVAFAKKNGDAAALPGKHGLYCRFPAMNGMTLAQAEHIVSAFEWDPILTKTDHAIKFDAWIKQHFGSWRPHDTRAQLAKQNANADYKHTIGMSTLIQLHSVASSCMI
jgi:hypothetical protein